MHISVLKQEIESLVQKIIIKNQESNYKAIDFTFGAGGHSEIILKNWYKNGFVTGIDRDINTQVYADELKKKYKNFNYFNDVSVNIEKYISHEDKVLFILGDLGLSQIQLNNERGFAYKNDTILDMQMGIGSMGSLWEFLQNQNTTFDDIANILREYGEEKNWYKIANKIYNNRYNINTTFQLKNIILSSVNLKHNEVNKCLSRCFQAFRIFINDEINILVNTLKIAYNILMSNGYLAIITFHSLEDKIVKNFFKKYLTNLEIIYPSEKEIKLNNQSRSATLRVGQKIN